MLVALPLHGGNSGFESQCEFRAMTSDSEAIPPSNGATQYVAILTCDNDTMVRWETNSAGFILESSPILPGTNWTPVLGSPQIIQDHFFLHRGVVITNENTFYRLRC